MMNLKKSLPLDSIEVLDGELELVHGGFMTMPDGINAGSGCRCDSGDGCGCGCGSGDGCGCGCSAGNGCGCGCINGAGCGCVGPTPPTPAPTAKPTAIP